MNLNGSVRKRVRMAQTGNRFKLTVFHTKRSPLSLFSPRHKSLAGCQSLMATKDAADPPRCMAEKKGEGKGEGFERSRPIKPPHPNLLPLVKGEEECWVGLNSVNLSNRFQ